MSEIEAVEQIGAKMKMLISQDWLRRKVETDPDLDGDAGDDMMARQPALSGDLAELVERYPAEINRAIRHLEAIQDATPETWAITFCLGEMREDVLTAITTLSEKLAAAENDAAAWKADAAETHLKLAAAEARVDTLMADIAEMPSDRDAWREICLAAEARAERLVAAERERDDARASFETLKALVNIGSGDAFEPMKARAIAAEVRIVALENGTIGQSRNRLILRDEWFRDETEAQEAKP